MRFNPAKIIVFAIFLPDKSNLSLDRCDIHQLGYGSLSKVTKTFAVIPLNLDYPLADEPMSPHLFEDFEVRRYLEKKIVISNKAWSTGIGALAMSITVRCFLNVYNANCYRFIKCSDSRMKLC